MKLKYVLMNEAGAAGDGGGAASDWRSSLPENIREDASLKDIKDVGSLASAFVSTKSMVGNSIRIPGPDASDDDRKSFNEKLMKNAPTLMSKPNFDDPIQSKEFYRTIGAPEDSKGYEFPKAENGIEIPEDRKNLIANAALEAGISKNQFNKVMSTIANADAQLMASNKKNIDDGITTLKSEWGNAFDDRMTSAKNIASKTGAPPSLVEAMASGVVGPDTYKWLYDLSTKFQSEGNSLGNQGKDFSNTKLTPSEAKMQVSEIMNNKAHPYWNSRDIGHATAVERMVKLHEAIGD